MRSQEEMDADQAGIDKEIAQLHGSGRPLTMEETKRSHYLHRRAREIGYEREGRNLDGSFKRPEFESLVGENGQLQDQYRISDDLKEVNYNAPELHQGDQTSYNRFRNEALRDEGSDSKWAKMMKQKVEQNKLAQLDNLGQMSANAQASAFDQLGATGGASSGARGMLAKNMIMDMMKSRQGARRDAFGQSLDVGVQDEQNRQKQLQDLMGYDYQKAKDVNAWNLGLADRDYKSRAANEKNRMMALELDNRNLLQEINTGRQDSMDKWKTQMQDWGNQNVANAQAKAASQSKGGGKK